MAMDVDTSARESDRSAILPFQGGVYSIFMHGRSRMTIDLRIPTMPGRSASGFYQLGRHCLHQARSAVSCLASPMKDELRPSKSRS